MSVGSVESVESPRERKRGVLSRILQALVRGLARVRATKRLILVYYSANLLCAVLIALPLLGILDQFAGRSLMEAQIAGRFDIHFWGELLHEKPGAVAGMRLPILLISAFYWWFSLFLSGGALCVLAGGEPYRPRAFWGAAAQFFGRFVRLTLWSLLLLLVLALIPLSAYGLQRLFFGSDPYEYVSYWGGWLRIGLAVLALVFFSLCFDYARIEAVLADERRMRRCLWRGIRFTLKNILATCGIVLALLLAGAVVWALYRLLAATLGASGAFSILILFLVQQIYVFCRMALRLTRYGSETELYKGDSPQ